MNKFIGKQNECNKRPYLYSLFALQIDPELINKASPDLTLFRVTVRVAEIHLLAVPIPLFMFLFILFWDMFRSSPKIYYKFSQHLPLLPFSIPFLQRWQ